MKPLWLYLHFPNLQLDALFVDDQHSDEQHSDDRQSASQDKVVDQRPVIIVNDKENATVQLNQAAQQRGIQAGMGLATASALCAQLQVLCYQQQVEVNKLREIAEHLYLKTSDICFFPPNGLLLRIHNMLALYGGLQPYWRALQQQLDSQRIRYQYATGRAGYAARVLALVGWNQVSENCQAMFNQLCRCDLRYTDIRPRYIEKLQRVGVHSLGDVIRLPLKDIAGRFDIELVTYLGRLKGELQHPVDFFHPDEKFSRYIELLYEISSTRGLLNPVERLLSELESFLIMRDLVVQHIHLQLQQREVPAKPVTVGAAVGENSAQQWSALCQLTFESIKLDAPVVAIQLTTGPLQPLNPEHQDLFAGRNQAIPHSQLISLLQAKLGEAAVRGIEFVADFRPEKATRLTPPPVATESHTDNHRATGQLSKLRPSLLFESPAQLRQKVSLLQGPERLVSGWWDDDHVVRDYFIARGEQGQLLWIYRTPQYQWYLHGQFS